MRILPLLLMSLIWTVVVSAAERPNVLWISCEDIGPHLGCYGCADAKTPTLDRLAARGVRYSHAFTTCPVCATNRSSIITGMYPTTIGTHAMRSQVRLPPDVKCFSEYLRDAGYYCANNSKTDYNFTVPKGAWDDSSNTAHWRNRRPGQPFFFVRNFIGTHESHVWPRGKAHRRQTSDLKPADRQDPAAVQIPPYYPDVPEVRRDWANYLENITQLDYDVTQLLKQLDNDGLADDTIVFFWSDHGAGLPRAKRWPYDSGTHVPLLVFIPEKFRQLDQGRPGMVDDQLVSAIDLAPTVLALCDVRAPANLQGRAFLGPHLSPQRTVVVSTRDRMDERTDMVRTLRDARFRYIRNFMPWRPYAQWIGYAERNATMQELRRQQKEGKDSTAALFMADRKPTEELYDTKLDPHEMTNLAIRPTPENQARLRQFRGLLEAWQLETRDLGWIPETLLAEGEEKLGNRRAILSGDAARQRIVQWQQLLRRSQIEEQLPPLDLASADVALRWWSVWTSAAPLLPRPPSKTPASDDRERQGNLVKQLRNGLKDDSPVVRVAAAEVLGRLDESSDMIQVLTAACNDPSPWTRLAAVAALDELGDRAATAKPILKKCLSDSQRYVRQAAARALDRAEAAKKP